MTATKEEKRKKQPKKTKSKKGHKALASSSSGSPSVSVTRKSKNDQDNDRPSLEITDLSDDSSSVRDRVGAEGGAAEGESKRKDSLLPVPGSGAAGSSKEKKKGKREKSANDLGKKAEGEDAQGARRAKSLGPARAKAVLKEIITDAISRDDSVVQKSDSDIVSPPETGKEKKPGKRPAGVAGSSTEETVGAKIKSTKEGKKKNKTTSSSASPKP